MESTSSPFARIQLPLLVTLYSGIVFGTLWWTSSVTNVTIYDKYLVRFEGVSLAVRDPERSIGFYREVLNFIPLPASLATEHSENRTGVLLPDKRKLFFERAQDSAEPRSPLVVLRVRNGFDRLHRELSERLARFRAASGDSTPPAGANRAISPIHSESWGEEFTVTDDDGNGVVFLQPRRRSGTRY